MTQNQQESMRAKLKELGIPAERIQVFGRIKINIHVTCRSLETAHKWAAALAEVSNVKPAMVKTRWPEGDKRDVSAPSKWIEGHLVAVAF